MAEVVSVEQDDSLYWAAGSEFIQVLISGLNNALKENGIADVKHAREYVLTSRSASATS